MQNAAAPVTIVLADDDEDDRFLIIRALRQHVANTIDTVGNGQELMEYLTRYHESRDRSQSLIVLLDLNMPRMTGHEALAAIRADERFRTIPVIILTTTGEQDQIEKSYRLGANAYMTKMMSSEDMLRMMRALKEYWFSVVRLP